MNIIKEKKIKNWIVMIALYLSFCFAGWYSSRSVLATNLAGMMALEYMANDVVAFFIAGLMPFLIYFLAIKLFTRSLSKTPFLPLGIMVYALPFFYIGANLVTGLISIIYFFVPIVGFWGGIIVPLISSACFFIWYLAFICKNYVKNYNWKAIILYFGRIYIFIALFLTALNLIAEII